MIIGIGVWVSFEFYLGWEQVYTLPPHFFGFLMSIIGFYAGQMLYTWIGNGKRDQEVH